MSSKRFRLTNIPKRLFPVLLVLLSSGRAMNFAIAV